MPKNFNAFKKDLIINETFNTYLNVCKEYSLMDVEKNKEKLKKLWLYLFTQHSSDGTLFEKIGPDWGNDEEIIDDTKDAIKDGAEALKNMANKSLMAVMSAGTLAVYFFKRKKVLNSLNKELTVLNNIYDLEKDKSDSKTKDTDEVVKKLEDDLEPIRKDIENLKGNDDEISVKKRKVLTAKRATILDKIEKLKDTKQEISKTDIEKIDELIKIQKEAHNSAKDETDIIVGENAMLKRLMAKNRLEHDLEFAKKMRDIMTDEKKKQYDKKIQELEKLAKKSQDELNELVTDAKKKIPEEDLDKELKKIEADEKEKKSKKDDNLDDEELDDETDTKPAPKKVSNLSKQMSDANKAKPVETPKKEDNKKDVVPTEKDENPQLKRLNIEKEQIEKDLKKLKDDLEQIRKNPNQTQWSQKFEDNIDQKENDLKKVNTEIEKVKRE